MRNDERDEGFTLIELMVSVVVLGIFMSVATGGFINLFQTASRTQALADAQQQLGIAFNRLDREIRYASGISTPGFVGAEPFVEFRTTYTGSPVCTQLRVRPTTGQLQQRTWTQGTGTVTPSPWTQLATNVTTTTQPFTLTAADATFNFQRLGISLTTMAGGVVTTGTRQFSASFTALNTSLNTDSSTACSEGRSLA
jgi:prepilin-type N-terminal cleavage/methylation domain-containing protein